MASALFEVVFVPVMPMANPFAPRFIKMALAFDSQSV
jgi:hypothetical protein